MQIRTGWRFTRFTNQTKMKAINRKWYSDGLNGQYSIMLKDQGEDESGDLALVNQFKTLSDKDAAEVAEVMAAAPELLKALKKLHTFSAQNNPTVGNYDKSEHDAVLIETFNLIQKLPK